MNPRKKMVKTLIVPLIRLLHSWSLECKVDISGPALQSLRQELSTIIQQKKTDKTTERISNQVSMNPT